MSRFEILLITWIVALGVLFAGSSLAAKVGAVSAAEETRAVFGDAADNKSSADDPAIWVHPTDPGKSVVIGTIKRGGLDVYDLEAKLLQHIPGDAMPSDMQLEKARYNNVDVIYGFQIGEKKVDLAVVTDRHNDMLRFFAIDPGAAEKKAAPLAEITAPGLPWVFVTSPQELKADATAYGLAVTQADPKGESAYAFVSRTGHTTVARLKIFADQGRIGYRVDTRFNLPEHFTLPNGATWSPCEEDDGELPQVEGMVVDDFHGVLYLAQERVGLWKTSVQEPSSKLALMARVREYGIPYEKPFDPVTGEHMCELKWSEGPGLGVDYLSADVEGLTIYDRGNGMGYLLVVSQGSNEFAIYDRASGDYIGNFAVVDGVVDGSEECDGAHVVSANLGGEYSEGLLVVQDGINIPQVRGKDGTARDNTDFKFIRWSDVAKSLGLPLTAISATTLPETDASRAVGEHVLAAAPKRVRRYH